VVVVDQSALRAWQNASAPEQIDGDRNPKDICRSSPLLALSMRLPTPKQQVEIIEVKDQLILKDDAGGHGSKASNPISTQSQRNKKDCKLRQAGTQPQPGATFFLRRTQYNAPRFTQPSSVNGESL
jgi:hypothetical protein